MDRYMRKFFPSLPYRWVIFSYIFLTGCEAPQKISDPKLTSAPASTNSSFRIKAGLPLPSTLSNTDISLPNQGFDPQPQLKAAFKNNFLVGAASSGRQFCESDLVETAIV